MINNIIYLRNDNVKKKIQSNKTCIAKETICLGKTTTIVMY